MKEKLISLTQKLTSAGFTIAEIDVENRDIVRIKFADLNGLEILVNENFAKIEQNECPKDRIKQLEQIIQQLYKLSDEIISSDDDMFQKLLHAN